MHCGKTSIKPTIRRNASSNYDFNTVKEGINVKVVEAGSSV
jgi:hypothetical protein